MSQIRKRRKHASSHGLHCFGFAVADAAKKEWLAEFSWLVSGPDLAVFGSSCL